VQVLAVQGMGRRRGRACRITVDEVKDLVAEANRNYEPARVRFASAAMVRISCNSATHADQQLDARKPPGRSRQTGAGRRNAPAAQSGAAQFAAQHPDCMVVFFRYGDKRKGATRRRLFGSRAKFVVMPGLRSTNMGLRGLAHEAGHYLGLSHTFAHSFRNVEDAEKYLRAHNNDLAVFDGDQALRHAARSARCGGKDFDRTKRHSPSAAAGNIMSIAAGTTMNGSRRNRQKLSGPACCRRFGDKHQDDRHSG